jgi:rhodanese-related sulfurtransferase
MSTTHCEPVIGIDEVRMLQRDPETRLIDVRSPTEFSVGHIPGAMNVPLDELESRTADLSTPGRKVLVCKSGMRAEMAYALAKGEVADLAILDGGTDAWARAGLPLVRSVRSRWALERQVRLVAGLIVLTAVTAGYVSSELWFVAAGAVGLGLTIAGATDFCGMGILLAKLPFNRSPSCRPCTGAGG